MFPSDVVDDRSILDVQPSDLSPHTRVHLFAGIAGWELALRLAGWPDDVPVWTGSCPCQPFSMAGRRRGASDDRHVWPEFFRLIRECRPPIVFGEQVASPAGRAWLDAVRADLEGVGFAFGAADLCAAGVGAPHLRQRLYWVAVADDERREGLGVQLRAGRSQQAVAEARGRGEDNPRLGDASDAGRSRRGGASLAELPREVATEPRRSGSVGGFWADAEWVDCADGAQRPAQPGAYPLASRVPDRLGLLRAYGNAIVPPLAAEFVGSVIDVLTE